MDRYGAYVDFWELMNEATASSTWYNPVVQYIHSIDPYDHPISTSWERKRAGVCPAGKLRWPET